MFLSEIVKKILQLLKAFFIADKYSTCTIHPRIIRGYALDLVAGERFVRLISGRIQQPYGYVLSVLNNMLTLANYIRLKLPQVLENNKSKFEEHCRDIKVLLKRFDILIAQHIQDKISQGLDPNDLDRVRCELDYAFRNMITNEWYGWISHSQEIINRHIILLKIICDNGEIAESEIEVISFLIKQALSSGSIKEIIDIDPEEF